MKVTAQCESLLPKDGWELCMRLSEERGTIDERVFGDMDPAGTIKLQGGESEDV